MSIHFQIAFFRLHFLLNMILSVLSLIVIVATVIIAIYSGAKRRRNRVTLADPDAKYNLTLVDKKEVSDKVNT